MEKYSDVFVKYSALFAKQITFEGNTESISESLIRFLFQFKRLETNAGIETEMLAHS